MSARHAERAIVPEGRQAWDFFAAVAASRRAQEAQREHETSRKDAAKTLAEKEQLYREALARKIVALHAEGSAWSVCGDLARGDTQVAALRYERDVAAGVVDAMESATWRHTATRKDVQEFVAWSRIVAPLGEQREGGR